MNSLSPERKTIYTMILTAIFAALSFAGTFVAIPMGISKVHLGNLVCIIAGLLCGGLVGGLSGAIGMTLNDLYCGYGPDTWVRTLIVKFLLGFLVGYLFRLIVRKKPKVDWVFIALFALFLAIFATFLTLYIVNGESFKVGTKTFKNSAFLVSILGFISLFFLGVFIFSKKIKDINRYVLLAASVGCTINIALEFALKIPFKVWMANLTWEGAFYYAIASLPSAVLTTIITIIFVTLIYVPVYIATRKFNKLNDLNDYLLEATTYRASKDDNEKGAVKKLKSF